MKRISLVMCRDKDCHAMFDGVPDDFKEKFENTVLPCGHLIGTIINSATCIKEAFSAQERLEHIRNRPLIDIGWNQEEE